MLLFASPRDVLRMPETGSRITPVYVAQIRYKNDQAENESDPGIEYPSIDQQISRGKKDKPEKQHQTYTV